MNDDVRGLCDQFSSLHFIVNCGRDFAGIGPRTTVRGRGDAAIVLVLPRRGVERADLRDLPRRDVEDRIADDIQVQGSCPICAAVAVRV